MAYRSSSRHAHLRTRMRAVNSVAIEYRRKHICVELEATPYEQSPDQLLAYGVVIEGRIRDFILDVAPLIREGLFPPQPNDRITDLSSGLVCSVAPITSGRPWRYTTSREDAIRVHTQVIGPQRD